MTNRYLKAIKDILPVRRPKLFDFNIAGLDDHVKMADASLKESEEAKIIIRDFTGNTNQEIDKLDNESDIRKKQLNKTTIANQIIAKLNELHEIGKRNVIYKTDYWILKQKLILTLARLFGSSLDREIFEKTVQTLEKDGIIPPESRTPFAKLCPMGRWL
ncbi:MAG: hypothetical protein AABZ15_02350 [Nitrospirota bacterium]